MAGGIEADSELKLKDDDCSFVWAEATHLYFHASSGFYHDPNAGWYYSSRDGLYYKFENGSYVLLEYQKVDECELRHCGGVDPDNPVQDDSYTCITYDSNKSDAYQCRETVLDEGTTGETVCTNNQSPENPPPPSQWLEETLIDLYLSGYNRAVSAANDSAMSLELADEENSFTFSAEGNNNELEEGEWIRNDCDGLANQDESTIDEDASRDEENWRSQYGQVVQSQEVPVPDFPVTDLWDWAMVTGSKKDSKRHMARLVGRLVKQSARLHPSMHSSGLFRTAPICEVRLDLVRVRTGQVYRLRSPSARCLASLSTYDSSNPTKDWSFPELSTKVKNIPQTKASGKDELKSGDGNANCKGISILPGQHSASKKAKSHAYRDRAAERRSLHGSFGVGPGQKSSSVSDVDGSPSPVCTSTGEAAVEALNMSFGAGSYARKILKNMGWKEGEALGNTSKGLIEPIQAIGNAGNAGLGWPQGRTKHQ